MICANSADLCDFSRGDEVCIAKGKTIDLCVFSAMSGDDLVVEDLYDRQKKQVIKKKSVSMMRRIVARCHASTLTQPG